MENVQAKYKVVNGTSYHIETSDEVIQALEHARATNKRIKIHYGDLETGRDWNEEHDTEGYVGRSTGSVNKIPLLIYNSRSIGGGAILDHCIVKITWKGRALYQHPKYQLPLIEIAPSTDPDYHSDTIVNGKLYGRHKTYNEAIRLKKRLLK